MAQRSGFWIGVALILVTLGVATLTFELVQRHRYSDMERRMEEALRDFEKRARLRINDEADLELVGEGEAPTAAFRLQLQPWAMGWRLVLDPPEDGFREASSQYISVWLPRRRRNLILKRPVVEPAWLRMHATPPVVALFDQVMQEHGVEYEFVWPDELAKLVPSH